jgi:hypothetical protein
MLDVVSWGGRGTALFGAFNRCSSITSAKIQRGTRLSTSSAAPHRSSVRALTSTWPTRLCARGDGAALRHVHDERVEFSDLPRCPRSDRCRGKTDIEQFTPQTRISCFVAPNVAPEAGPVLGRFISLCFIWCRLQDSNL